MKASILLALAASVTLTACGPVSDIRSSGEIERSAVASNQKRLMTDTPLPPLKTSLERKNLAERLERINKQNLSGCVYLISYGTVMAFYPVRGKVSSLNSYLTGQESIVKDPNGSYDSGSLLMEQPDLDGAYGENARGVFFFTADTNTYVEWQGEYLWSDSCLALNQQPKLIRNLTK